MIGCYAVGGVVTLHLLVKSDWQLLPLVLVGAFLSFFYTAGPFKLKYHALGDVTVSFFPFMFLSFSFFSFSFFSLLFYYC
jgi:1,4-dihydroxy-2-naphthoate octaprenyltransferase